MPTCAPGSREPGRVGAAGAAWTANGRRSNGCGASTTATRPEPRAGPGTSPDLHAPDLRQLSAAGQDRRRHWRGTGICCCGLAGLNRAGPAPALPRPMMQAKKVRYARVQVGQGLLQDRRGHPAERSRCGSGRGQRSTGPVGDVRQPATGLRLDAEAVVEDDPAQLNAASAARLPRGQRRVEPEPHIQTYRRRARICMAGTACSPRADLAPVTRPVPARAALVLHEQIMRTCAGLCTEWLFNGEPRACTCCEMLPVAISGWLKSLNGVPPSRESALRPAAAAEHYLVRHTHVMIGLSWGRENPNKVT